MLLCHLCFLHRSPLWTSGISPRIASVTPFLGPWGHLAVAAKDHGPWWDSWPFIGCPGSPPSTSYIIFMGTGILGSQKSREDKLRGSCTLTTPINKASQRRKCYGMRLFHPSFPVNVLHIYLFSCFTSVVNSINKSLFLPPDLYPFQALVL